MVVCNAVYVIILIFVIVKYSHSLIALAIKARTERREWQKLQIRYAVEHIVTYLKHELSDKLDDSCFYFKGKCNNSILVLYFICLVFRQMGIPSTHFTLLQEIEMIFTGTNAMNGTI